MNERTAVFVLVGTPGGVRVSLRQTLRDNQTALAADGVLYREWAGPSRRVVEEARAWTGTRVVIFDTALGTIEEQARQLTQSLRPADVHVVLIARDLAPFWGLPDAGRVLRAWRAVPADRIHVVTVPSAQAPPTLVWSRLATLLGIDPARYATHATTPGAAVADADLSRRIGVALGPGETERIAACTGGRAMELVEELRGAYDVVGDLEELVPPPSASGRDDRPADLAPTQAGLDAAVDILLALIQQVGRLPGQGQPFTRRIRELEEELTQRRRRPFRSFVDDMKERGRTALRLWVARWRGAIRDKALRHG